MLKRTWSVWTAKSPVLRTSRGDNGVGAGGVLSSGKVIAALTRRFGVQRFELVENAVQEAYVCALERWPDQGSPSEPEKWLVLVAHNTMVAPFG